MAARVPSSNRGRAVVVAIVIVVGAVSGGLYWMAEQIGSGSAVVVFDPARPFCEEARQQTFTAGVDGVASTRGGAEFRSVVAGVRAEILRAVARRDGTSTSAATGLRALASLLDRAGETGDFRAARSAAAALDHEAATTCR